MILKVFNVKDKSEFTRHKDLVLLEEAPLIYFQSDGSIRFYKEHSHVNSHYKAYYPTPGQLVEIVE